MNAHLAHVLSCVYAGALAPEHRNDLRKSGLTEATVSAHFIRSAPPHMIGRLLGFDVPEIRSALLFPFLAPTGGFVDHVRMKIFPPLEDADGHSVKYLQPRGVPPRLYFTVPLLRDGLDADTPLWALEGEKKSLAVAQLGRHAFGFCGVEGWHRSRSFDLLPDFAVMHLTGRIVELVPDGDVQTNPNVAAGIFRFAEALRRRGAKPRLVVLPSIAETTR